MIGVDVFTFEQTLTEFGRYFLEISSSIILQNISYHRLIYQCQIFLSAKNNYQVLFFLLKGTILPPTKNEWKQKNAK